MGWCVPAAGGQEPVPTGEGGAPVQLHLPQSVTARDNGFHCFPDVLRSLIPLKAFWMEADFEGWYFIYTWSWSLYHSSRLRLLPRKFLTLLWQDVKTSFLADPPQVRELTKDIRAEHQTHSKNRVEAQHAIVDSIASFIHKWDSKGLGSMGWMGWQDSMGPRFGGNEVSICWTGKIYPPKTSNSCLRYFRWQAALICPSIFRDRTLHPMNWQGTRPWKAKRTCRDRVCMYERHNLGKLCLWETSTLLIAFAPGTGNSSNGMSAFRMCTNSISNEPWSRLCDPKRWVAPPSNELRILENISRLTVVIQDLESMDKKVEHFLYLGTGV